MSESLKNSRFFQGAKQWGIVNKLGKVNTVATYAQLGITFVSSGIDAYGKTGSIGKGVIGGAIDTLKSVGPLEGMTIGATDGGLPGAVVGGVAGLINVGVQFIWPNAHDNLKDGAYKLYDKGVETVGKGISQGVETVKNVCKDVQNAGKWIGSTLSSVKLSEIKFGW